MNLHSYTLKLINLQSCAFKLINSQASASKSINRQSYVFELMNLHSLRSQSLNNLLFLSTELFIVVGTTAFPTQRSVKLSPCCRSRRPNVSQCRNCTPAASCTRRRRCTLSSRAWDRRTPWNSTSCCNAGDSSAKPGSPR